MPKLFAPIISESNHYIASTIDKESRLKQMPSPKIIIMGGSGSAYSINSQPLEDSLKTPVINMAVAYGMGLTFMMEEVKNSIKKSDKIVLIAEYNLPLEGNKKLLTLLNDLNPDASNYFNFDLIEQIEFSVSNFQRVGSSLFYLFKNKNKTEVTPLRNSFNNHGDMVSHLNLPNTRPLKDQEKLYNNLYIDELKSINSFVAFAETKGAKVYFCFPAYPKTEYIKNQAAIEFWENRIKSNFKGEILNTPEDNLYEENEFFDTVYHLNKIGRDKRSQYLAKVLKNKIRE
ncbi:MAG: hypothetical protein V4683_13460 [Bacteroidota bacterium]